PVIHAERRGHSAHVTMDLILVQNADAFNHDLLFQEKILWIYDQVHLPKETGSAVGLFSYIGPIPWQHA
ncbi:MAG: hypothetical protein ACRDHW_06165, partial [Ktedonobacteraceae bacterium]